jgi:hypothetical protein
MSARPIAAKSIVIKVIGAKNRDKNLFIDPVCGNGSCPRRKLSKFIDEHRQDRDHIVDIFVTVISTKTEAKRPASGIGIESNRNQNVRGLGRSR